MGLYFGTLKWANFVTIFVTPPACKVSLLVLKVWLFLAVKVTGFLYESGPLSGVILHFFGVSVCLLSYVILHPLGVSFKWHPLLWKWSFSWHPLSWKWSLFVFRGCLWSVSLGCHCYLKMLIFGVSFFWFWRLFSLVLIFLPVQLVRDFRLLTKIACGNFLLTN